MNEFLSTLEISKLFEIKVSRAYKIIKSLNDELEKKGFPVLAGKINK